MSPEILINWSELSRLLCNDRTSISKNRVSEKHKEKIDALKLAIEKWYADYVEPNKASRSGAKRWPRKPPAISYKLSKACVLAHVMVI